MVIVVYTYTRTRKHPGLIPIWDQRMIDVDSWYTYYEWDGYWYPQERIW